MKSLSDEIDHGTYQHDCHPMMVQQNKWRAARFGNQAMLVDTYTYQTAPVAQVVDEMVANAAADGGRSCAAKRISTTASNWPTSRAPPSGNSTSWLPRTTRAKSCGNSPTRSRVTLKAAVGV